MQRSTKVLLGVMGGVLVAILAFGIADAAYAMQTGHPFFAAANSGYSGMMGNGGYSGNNGYSGMMGNGGYGGMMGSRSWAALNGQPVVATSQVALTSADAFSPAVIQVTAGTTVTWTNADTDTHTVTFMPMMVSSGNLTTGASFSFTFTTPGTYDYFCMYHQGMIGRVIVTT